MGLLQNAAQTFKIKAALVADERIHAENINVDSEDGVVRLHGTVPYEAIRELAEVIALRSGAHRVVNELQVSEESFATPSVIIPDDAPVVTASSGAEPVEEPHLDEKIRVALAADDRVNEHLVVVHVENGLAHLTGRQDTVDQVKAAIETAAHVPGVLGVSNDLQVMPAV